jgi:hypothetical protein
MLFKVAAPISNQNGRPPWRIVITGTPRKPKRLRGVPPALAVSSDLDLAKKPASLARLQFVAVEPVFFVGVTHHFTSGGA